MAASVNPTISAFTADSFRRTRTARGIEIHVDYVGPNDSSALATFYAAHPFGEQYETSGATLYEASETPERGTGISSGVLRITLSYRPPDAAGAQGAIGGSQPVGYSSLESDSNPVEWPIEKKPPASTAMADAAWALQAADLKGKGTESWIDPQPTVTRTDVVESSSLTMSESEIVGATGKVLSQSSIGSWGVSGAAGDGSGNSKWLMTGKRITLNGETKTIVRTAQRASQGWDVSYIYESGSESV